MSNTLRPHGLQHARPPCPSPTPRACSNSCPSRRWCHPTISSSVILLFSCLQSFPGVFYLLSGSFPMSWFSVSGDQSIGVSASASVLAMNIQAWFPLGLTGWISLQSKGLSRDVSNTVIYIYKLEFKPIPIFPWKQNCVLASLGYHNKITQARYILWVLEADKSKIKVSANLVPGENSLSGLQTAAFPAVSSHGLFCAGIPLHIKPPILPD